MAQPARQLDSRIEVVTPEHIAFHYVLAGPFRRLPALLVDMGVRAAILALLALLASLTSLAGAGGLGFGAVLVGWFVLAWFYGGLFETLWNGQTPGKRLFGLRVLTIDGQPINALQAVLRNVLRELDSMPLVGGIVPVYILGLGTMAANNRFQRLGDLAAGTIVVVEERSRLRGVAPMQDRAVITLARSLPLQFPIGKALAQALSAYETRRLRFSVSRRIEISRALAEPISGKLGLPAGTNPDLLLRALYYRAFIADRPQYDEEPPKSTAPVASAPTAGPPPLDGPSLASPPVEANSP